jgi:hypothetical protein
MKKVEAKVVENRKEDPASERDRDPNTWLIEAKLDEDILNWEVITLFVSDPGLRDHWGVCAPASSLRGVALPS